MSLPEEKKAEIDEKFAKLQAAKSRWVLLPIREKIEYLKRMRDNIIEHQNEWVETVLEHRRLPREVGAEERGSSIYPTLRLIRMLIISLTPSADLQGDDIVIKTPPKVELVDDQYEVTVYPDSKMDALMFPGISAKTYIEKGKPFSQATALKESYKGDGVVSLVLGAGNQASIPFMDALYKLYNENQVVFLKHNPVLEYFAPIIEKVMQPFIEEDFFHHTTGGAEEGRYLVEICDNVHITGSDKTHDIIVWGKRNKETDEPIFEKEITSELGCVSPWIITPCDYTDKQLNYLVQHIVGATVNNNSFNCNAAKLLVTSRSWELREEFLTRIKDQLTEIQPRYAYYPGAKQRYQEFLNRYDQCEKIVNTEDEDFIPWTLIPGIPPEGDPYAFQNEPFCPILSEVDLDCESISDFLKESVDFCNDKVWGNLSCSLYIEDSCAKEYEEELKEAIKNLRYGGVAVNCWAALNYALGSPIWGAFPGNSSRNIQSGKGSVHNSFFLDYPEKSVVFAPFTLLMSSKYPYFPNHANTENVYRSLINYESNPSIKTFAKSMWSSLWG